MIFIDFRQSSRLLRAIKHQHLKRRHVFSRAIFPYVRHDQRVSNGNPGEGGRGFRQGFSMEITMFHREIIYKWKNP